MCVCVCVCVCVYVCVFSGRKFQEFLDPGHFKYILHSNTT